MARAHSTETIPSTPGVHFERSDVDLSTVVWAGVTMTAIVVVLSAATLWFGRALTRHEDSRKRTPLPPAAVDRTRPPEPRLEALEDLSEGKVQLHPSRKQASSEEQEKAIAAAIVELAGHLKSRNRPAPSGYAVPLPSKASSGRVETGEK
jgi:hypothetical protein